MSFVETGQMSGVETGQMSTAETGQMSAVETRQILKSQTRGRAQNHQNGLKWLENSRQASKESTQMDRMAITEPLGQLLRPQIHQQTQNRQHHIA